MREILSSLAALMLAVALLMLGTGLFNTFVGLRTAMEGFPKEATGLMMSAYYGGLVVATLYSGPLINRIGHIRAFAAFSSISSAVVLIFPFSVSVPYWAALRAINGFCLAGALMVAESWLNTRATGRNRGTLLSLYMMTTFLAVGSGQLLLNVGDTAELDLFLVTAILMSLALVPVTLTRASHPAPVEAAHFGFRRLYTLSPVAVVACVVSGLSTGALFGMGPVFGRDVGLTLQEISQFMGILVISGLVLQLPVGRLSDRMDRRWVIIGVNLVSVIASLAVAAVLTRGITTMTMPGGDVTLLWRGYVPALLTTAAVYGGISATIYPLAVAYANDFAEARHAVAVSGGLVLAYGIGAAAGPILAAASMRLGGPEGLFYFCALISAMLAGFALYRTRRRQWVEVAEKESFVPLPEGLTTPVALELDPRGEGIQLELDLEPGDASQVTDPDYRSEDSSKRD